MSVQLEALADEVFGAAAAQARAGARTRRWPFGEAIWNPAYSGLCFLNGIGDLVAPNWRANDFERAAREAMPEVRAFRAYSRDPQTISTLGPALVAAGYHHEVRVAMVQVFTPPAPSPSGAGQGGGWTIVPVDRDVRWAAYQELVYADTDDHTSTPDMREQLIALYRWRASQTPTRFYLACEANHAVAYVGLFQHGPIAYLHGLFTHPAARRRGAGRALTLAMHDEAMAMGCDRLTLQCVDDGYLPAYYARLGFRAVGEQHNWTKAF